MKLLTWLSTMLPSTLSTARSWTMHFVNAAGELFSVTDTSSMPHKEIDQRLKSIIEDPRFNLTTVEGGSTTHFLQTLCQYKIINMDDDIETGQVQLYSALNRTIDEFGLREFLVPAENVCADGAADLRNETINGLILMGIVFASVTGGLLLICGLINGIALLMERCKKSQESEALLLQEGHDAPPVVVVEPSTALRPTA